MSQRIVDKNGVELVLNVDGTVPIRSAQQTADSVIKGGSASAPTAGTAFVQTAGTPAAGVYKITIGYVITGATETAQLNVRLTLNGAAFGDFPSNMNAVTNGLMNEVVLGRVTLDGVNVVKMTAVASAVASTVYAGYINYERIA